MSPSRRDALRLGATTLGAAVSGCLTGGDADGRAPTDRTTRRSRFADRSCPSLRPSADRTVCYHAIDPADPPPVYLEPSTERLTDRDAELAFTLHNRSDRTVEFRECHPRAYRRRAEGWVPYAARGGYVACNQTLDPGERFRWRPGAGRDAAAGENASVGDWFGERVLDGTYAFVTTATPLGGEESPTTACLALFQVATETPLTTTPTRTARESFPSAAVRCRGDPVAVARSVADEPGYEDGIRYFPGNRRVRFVASRDGGEPQSFQSSTLAEWARSTALGALGERIRAVTADRLGTRAVVVRRGDPPTSADVDPPALWVHARATETVSGALVPAPVSLDALAGAAPRTARATVSLEGDAVDLVTPVFAQVTRRR
jgi:hypothetical protein